MAYRPLWRAQAAGEMCYDVCARTCFLSTSHTACFFLLNHRKAHTIRRPAEPQQKLMATQVAHLSTKFNSILEHVEIVASKDSSRHSGPVALCCRARQAAISVYTGESQS